MLFYVNFRINFLISRQKKAAGILTKITLIYESILVEVPS